MSHTNSTTNYSLPQFVTTDKPAWLTDVNNAYAAIDTGMYNAQTKANTADTNASQALLDAASAASAASAADAKGAGAVASIADTFQTTETYEVGDLVIYNNLLYICSTAVTDPGPWTGSTNWSRATVEGFINDKVNGKAPIIEGHTRSYFVPCCNSANSFKRLYINFPYQPVVSRVVTLNSVKAVGSSTELKDKFSTSLDNINGVYSLYSSDSDIQLGYYYEINVTIAFS